MINISLIRESGSSQILLKGNCIKFFIFLFLVDISPHSIGEDLCCCRLQQNPMLIELKFPPKNERLKTAVSVNVMVICAI